MGAGMNEQRLDFVVVVREGLPSKPVGELIGIRGIEKLSQALEAVCVFDSARLNREEV